MFMKYKNGDIFADIRGGQLTDVAHGCNAFHAMGSGIAPYMNQECGGQLLKADMDGTTKGDRNKLGQCTDYTKAYDFGVVHFYNFYTQFTYWDANDMLSLDAVYDCFRNLAIKFEAGGDRYRAMGIPLIGCGKAQGNWSDVEAKIMAALDSNYMGDHLDMTVYLRLGDNFHNVFSVGEYVILQSGDKVFRTAKISDNRLGHFVLLDARTFNHPEAAHDFILAETGKDVHRIYMTS